MLDLTWIAILPVSQVLTLEFYEFSRSLPSGILWLYTYLFIVRPRTTKPGPLMRLREKCVVTQKYVTVVSFWNFMAIDMVLVKLCGDHGLQTVRSSSVKTWSALMDGEIWKHRYASCTRLTRRVYRVPNSALYHN